ncbi:MAG TPA: response regulator [Bacillus bacterium]|uniref:Chemotaxis protein CheY n=1 Tax=Siminovitchia fordii TaxID=254759 RepID=A0ABQ4K260_9BACI|nr:response regulator [Siminovitchia fordii]GIN19173.1 chemotaxis protein CheY [Siminovitchia fordii]HBZ10221.1 response regulator [Bacillus sp. (in: firmicutes)]
MKILIVDDAAFMRMTLRKMLEEFGHEVIGEAVDGNDAVEKYKELKPDLVTMDITMPNKDGITATKEIKQYDPKAKVLISSAMGQESMVKEAIIAGAVDFIVKPINPQRMMNAVAKAAKS